ncbi:MAG: hypothetical protein DI533_00795 [Cereibacter sphaeroides]|uniref:Uncharacterized protein n=1 Tax=Cereibacter sphaeroides TaxID=1063 RepID=A0A2W5SIY2_CERSP|nr:MAG: hypothetical protein DI533_00795 [Cereibacter sphaeroides]
MTRQNRVMPDGEMVAIPARGTLTGNRGILHDAEGRMGEARWRHPHWIACELEYKGWRRQVMAPGRWTELFFLDEAVALSAGHRPCALCRRADYNAFRAGWGRVFGREDSAAEMDRVLHAARVLPGTRNLATHRARFGDLPDGSFIRQDRDYFLILGGGLLPFAPQGYGQRMTPPPGEVEVLTPEPMVRVLAAGYRPRLHPSAA